MQIFCGDRILWWPRDKDGKATGEVVVILSYPEDGTNRIECGCIPTGIKNIPAEPKHEAVEENQ